MSTTTDEIIPPTQRALAVLGYLGLAPFCRLLGRKPGPYLEHHTRQALALFALLGAILLLFVTVIAVLSLSMIYIRPLYEDYKLEAWLLTFTRWFFLAWLVVWAYGIGLAALGSWREMPLVGWLAEPHRRRLHQSVAVGLIVVMGLLALTAGLAWRADRLAATINSNGRAYMLYDDIDVVPRWVFALGFYRISGAATERWGEQSAVAAPINRENLRHALQHARFIFLATHGKAQGLIVEGGWLTPSEVAEMTTHEHLQFVYLTGCDSGEQRRAWEEAFAPAEVVTYTRLSTVVEHAWWMWMTGPEKIRRLPPASNPAADGGEINTSEDYSSSSSKPSSVSNGYEPSS